MKTLFALLTASLLGLSGLAHADKIYRWTDENGQTHFGSQPPKNVAKQAEQIQIKAQNVPGDTRVVAVPKDNQAPAEKKTASADDENNKSIIPASISAEDADKNCQAAKNAKQALNYNHSTRFKQDDGSYRPLTNEERAKHSERVDTLISEFCS